LDPPPESDPAVADRIAVASAALYGRHGAAVEADLRAALARIELSHRASLDQSRAGQGSAGVARDATTTDGKPVQQSGEKKARNDHRPPKRVRTGPHQATLFDQAAAGEGASDEAPSSGEAGRGEAMEEGEPLA
nr:hypothetical protein [Dehalococcoidales bacterium]